MSGNWNWNPAATRRPGTTRRLLITSSVSGAQEYCPHFEHPPCRRQSQANAAQPPQDPHHVAVGQRIGRSQVDRAAHGIVGDQPFDSPAESAP